MPILNPDKCYTQQPQRLAITVPTTLPDDWRTDFYARLSTQLKLNDDKAQAQEDFDHQTNTWRRLTKRELFFKNLDRHLGPQSTYSLKPQLLDSFRTLYILFTHPTTSDDKRYLIASRIHDNVEQCTAGFTNQVNYLITLFNMPQNQDELIAQVRFKLVDKIARIIAAKNTQGIHVHNRVIVVARGAGLGVWPINTGDVYLHTGSQNISDEDIISRLQMGFANHFQLFALLNALRDELEALIVPHGYQGKRDLKNDYKQEEYEKFFECLNRFVPMQMGELLEIDEMSGKITDINWQYVKHQLLQKLRAEKYVTLSEEESALLDKSLLDETSSLDSTTLTPLISNGYELVQCLEYFSWWSMEQKAALVRAYLNNKSPNDQKEVLAILHNEAPQLTAQLKKEPNLQAIYFAIAITEKDVAAVRTHIEAGADINEALLVLFSQAHKSDTLYWLHEHPELLQTLTVEGMNTVIEAGKYQGKTVAETLVSTKKGRQLVLENVPLQTLIAQTSMVNTLADSLKQAEIERSTAPTQEGFFKKSFPLAIQLVQLIVYGDLTKSKALLKANPSLLDRLLTEKVTVIDYSRRKVKQKTAFQAALCAMDNELCAMLARYMPQEERLRQCHEIFPKGHKAYSQKQTPFDFGQIVQIISDSIDADVQQALSLELPNETGLWSALEKFRVDFTEGSSQETVFNPKHLIKAFEHYNTEFNGWSSNQRDLFWCQVVGFVQRFLPANSAMDFAQGLHLRVEARERSKRSFNFLIGDGAIFPPSFDSFSGLGYEYGVSGPWRGIDAPPGEANFVRRDSLALFSTLMSSKNSELERIMQFESIRSQIRCCLIQ